MSVILKGCEIEMPHSCDICPFCGCDYTCMNYTADCYGEDIGDYSMCRHEKCNLVEIPEGASLIDKRIVKEKMIPLDFSVQKWISEVDLDLYVPTVFEEEEK